MACDGKACTSLVPGGSQHRASRRLKVRHTAAGWVHVADQGTNLDRSQIKDNNAPPCPHPAPRNVSSQIWSGPKE